MRYRKAGRKGYTWPAVTVIHPEHGSYRMNVHGVRHPDGAVTLMAFTFDQGQQRKQVDLVFSVAAAQKSDVIQLEEADIPEDLGVFLAAKAHASPETGVLVLAGGEWGIGEWVRSA